MKRRSVLALAPLALLAPTFAPARARAEMWCADPLWAHEWGVVVFGARSATRTAGPSLPGHFHRPGGARSPSLGAPARTLPADSGERELPVLAFYTAGSWSPPPIGLELGFRDGAPSRWFPDVDGLASTGAQLRWDRLELSEAPRHPLVATTEPWVRALRDAPRALWVNRTTAAGGESERFVFYEGQTRERPAIVLRRGPSWAPGRRHVLLENTGGHPVHDAVLVVREAGSVFVLHAPSIPPRAHAGYVIEEHAVAPAALTGATRDRLRAALVDPAERTPSSTHAWGGPRGCVMQRDPATPTRRATDHRLFDAEIEVLLDAWSARFFDAPGATLVYREDVAQLDEVMPLAIYTDMYHHPILRRLGLALVENVTLP